MGDRGDAVRRHRLQLPRPTAALRPEAGDPPALRHRQSGVCLDRERVPRVLCRDVSRLGAARGPVRPEARNARRHRHMVARVRGRRHVRSGAGCPLHGVPRHPGPRRADGLCQPVHRGDALVRAARACDGQLALPERRRHRRRPRARHDRCAHGVARRLAARVLHRGRDGPRDRGRLGVRLPHARARRAGADNGRGERHGFRTAVSPPASAS